MEKQRQCRHGRGRNELERVELESLQQPAGRNARNSRISEIVEIYMYIYICVCVCS